MTATLVYWDSNPNPGRSESFKLAGEHFAREADIQFVYEPVGIHGYVDKVVEAWAAGNGPDVIDVWPMWLPELTKPDRLMPINSWVEAWPARERYDPSHCQLSQDEDGRFWFLACDLFLQGTHYRKDLVELAGLEDPAALDRKDAWTLDQFVAHAAACHHPGRNINGVSLRGGQGGELTVLNLMVSANDGHLFDNEGRCLLDTAPAIEALRYYVSLATPDPVCQHSAASDGYREFAWEFYEGRAAFMIHNDDGIKAANQWYLGRDRYGSARMPALNGIPWVGLAGFGVGVNSRSNVADLAAKYVCYFVENYGSNLRKGSPLPTEQQSSVLISCGPMRPYPEKRDPLVAPFRQYLDERTQFYTIPWRSAAFSNTLSTVVQPDISRLFKGEADPAVCAANWARLLSRERGPASPLGSSPHL